MTTITLKTGNETKESKEGWTERRDFNWQWRHREGFRSYEDVTNRRIEAAYRSGRAFVIVKSGKRGTEPMEIFFADMLQHDPVTGNNREVRRQGAESFKFKASRKMNEVAHILEHGKINNRSLFGEDAARERDDLLEDIDRRTEEITSKYHDTGIFAAIARSSLFLIVGTLVVFLNGIWLGIDANYNHSDTLYDADWGFAFVENLFCSYFVAEILVRFGAFKSKLACVRDAWMLFDFLLVFLMVGEIWLLPLYMAVTRKKDSAGRGGWAVLRMARMLRIARLARLARVIRQVPELMSMCKAIFIALRSVFFAGLLLFVLIYMFAIIFVTQLRGNTDVTDQLKDFKTMHGAMWVLLIEGVLLDGPKDTLGILVEHSYVLTGVFLVFIGVSAFTIVNMLIGILCNVVDQVSQNEKDEASVTYLKSTLLELLECHDEDNDHRLKKEEFELLLRNPVTNIVLTRFGVDTADLLSMKENLFDDKDNYMSRNSVVVDDGGDNIHDCRLSFAEFMRVVLRLRGGNAVRVTDMVDLREFIKQRLDTNREYISQRIRLLEEHAFGHANFAMVGNGIPEHEKVESEKLEWKSPAAMYGEWKALLDSNGPLSPAAANQSVGTNLVRESTTSQSSGGSSLRVTAAARPSESQHVVSPFLEVRSGLQQLISRQMNVEQRQTTWQQELMDSQEKLSQQISDVQKQLAQICRVYNRGRSGMGGAGTPSPTDHGWRPNPIGTACVSQTSGWRRQHTVEEHTVGGLEDEEV